MRASWTLTGLECDAMQDGGVWHVTHDATQHEKLVVYEPNLGARIAAASGRLHALPGGAHERRFCSHC